MNVKRILPLLAVTLLFASCAKKGDSVLPLDKWQFSYLGEWHDATVPGCIHTDLMAEGLMQDPFLDTNERRYAWVSDSAWTYRATFGMTRRQLRQARHHDLVFAGLDTYAEIFLNGHRVGEAHNMFRTWRYAIDPYLVKGNNVLEVRFSPEKRHDDSCAAAAPFPLPDKRAFSRTAPYQQGWDWGPALNTCGIWQPCWIEGWDKERPEGTQNGVGMDGFFGPWGHDGTTMPSKLDYKTVELKRDSGAFCIAIDGKPVFMKGANWIPAHSFPVLDKAQKERYRHLLRSAKEAHFNMIRVWGGGIYEPDFFYELCDSLGIYVWQDFDYSCALYPGDKDFLENASIEAIEQVRRLAKHKCIVLWCGNNEVDNGWHDWGWQGQYGYTPQQCQKIEADMDTLFGAGGILARAVKRYAPGKPYVPSSPTWGWGHEESAKDGDAHYWGVWWGELPFERYRDMTGRFMSEYGFMGYPELSTIRKFFPEIDRLMDSATAADILTLPAMRSHQRHARGIAIIDQAMQRYFGVTARDVSFPRYLYLSQLCEAYGTGMGIEAHRTRKGHCWGTLYWQLNDCWPVASWSSIDHYGNWKALHYAAKRLYGDLAVLAEPADEEGGVNIQVVCDSKPLKGKLLLSLCDFQNNAVQQQEEELTSGERLYYCLPGGAGKEDLVLLMQLYDENDMLLAENLHCFVTPKRMNMPKANVTCNMANDGTVYVSTDNFAYGVALRTEPYVAGHFSDNYFDMMPSSTPRVVTFIPDNKTIGGKTKVVAEWYNR